MTRRVFGGYVAAIDIGTTKICVLIGIISNHGKLEIVGIGQHPSNGLRKGVVVNINLTVESIKAALAQAQEAAGFVIEAATVGISGGHIKSYNSTGVVAVKGKDVTQYDIDRVIEAAKAIPIPQDQEILHVLPQYFRIDGQEYVLDSLGMYGVRLEAQVHIITGAVASAQNIIKSCELAGVKVEDIALEQIASADAVLTASERELGSGIIDIGGGTSDFAVYKDGRIRHSKVLPIAGSHFTNDLAVGLGISKAQAEEVKRMYGSVLRSPRRYIHGESVALPQEFESNPKVIPLALIDEILHFRAQEVFDFFADEIQEYRLRSLMPTGVVLTGGGSLLQGIRELAEDRLGMPVRLGSPISTHEIQINGLPDVLRSPIYSTAYGLMLYASGGRSKVEGDAANGTVFASVFRRMKSWIYDFL